MRQSPQDLRARAFNRVHEQAQSIRRQIRFIKLRTDQQLPTDQEKRALVEMYRTFEDLRQDLATILRRARS